jgi:glycosyltransferase involved in cell wall biosynthesis
MATEWVKRGYNVTVLTGIPNYPMGKFFPGYSWTKKRTETWNGIKIIRIPLIARGHSSIGMVLNYYSFVISGWFWNRFNKVDADLVFSFETSPMTQVKVGCGYAKKHKVPHFLYVQDLWPENVETVTGIHNRLIIGPIDRMVDKIYKQTDKIFVTSPSFVEAVVNRKNSVDRNKVYYWPQYAEEFYRPVDKHVYEGIPDDDSFKVVFTGNIGTAQGLDILPKTAKLMKDDNVRFVVVGDGRYQSEFEKHIDDCGVRDKFILLPRVKSTLIPSILAACDVGFISFNKTPLWEMTIPAKLQSYMACGMPIIASASGETKRIIEEAQCGICSEIGNPVSLSEGIRKIMSLDLCKLGHNAREYFDSNFVKKSLMDEMDQYFIQEIGNK